MTQVAIAPDKNAIQLHLALITARVPGSLGLKLELAWGQPESGPSRARCFSFSELDLAAATAVSANAAGNNVYVGTTLKAASAPIGRRTRSEHAALATMLPIDIDSDLIAGARKLPFGIRPQLLAVTGRQPTLRGHIWINVAPTQEMDLWDDVLLRTVELCGGDMAARGRSRVMRLAGTVSHPSEVKRRRGYVAELVTAHVINAPTYDLDALSSTLPRRRAPLVLPNEPRLQSATSARANLIDVSSALRALPDQYAEEHEPWLRTGFALNDFDPSGRGLELWKAFSARCPEKAAATDFERRWQTFGRPAARRITIRWLFAEARRHGWRTSHSARRAVRQ